MAQVTLKEIHKDLEVLKRDISILKTVLVSDEGPLTNWAKERLNKYLKFGPKRLISREDVEKEFL